MDAELKQYLDEFNQKFVQIDVQFREMREENVAAHEETRTVLRGEIAEAVSTLRREDEARHEETRRHFDVMVEGMESRFGLLAEHVETLDRDVAEIKRRTL